jgi:hypothetical protein
MFRLGYKARRSLCRLGFLALCLAPTAGVCAWGVSRMLPSHARDVADDLARDLGLDLRVGRVTHPRPGAIVLLDVSVDDPESGREVMRADRARIERSTDGLLIVTHALEVDATTLPVLWRALERGLSRRPAASAESARLAAAETTLLWPDRRAALWGLAMRLDPLAAGPRVSLEARLTDDPSAQPVRLTVFRDRQSVPPRGGFELETGPQSIDAALVSPALPADAWLGAKARFSGYLWARQGAAGWEGIAQGQLTDVDARQLLATRFSHNVNGAARIDLSRARFEGGRLIEAAGMIDAGPGFVSRGLLAAASRSLRVPWAESRGARDDLLAYDRLAAEFQIEGGQLTLLGRCADAPLGTLLVEGDRVLLAEPAEQPQPVAGLVRMLAAPDDELVPAGPGTDWLIRVLPIGAPAVNGGKP